MLEVDPLSGAITMDRGDYFDPQFAIVDAAGSPLNVTGATFKLTVKKSIDDPIGSAIFQLTTGAGDFDTAGQAGGIIKAKGLETLTQGLAGAYVYDFEMVLGSKTRTLRPGARLFIRKDVSTPGSAPAAPAVLVPFPGDIQVIGGNIYIKDTGVGPDAGKYWKLRMVDGDFRADGPSTVVPF